MSEKQTSLDRARANMPGVEDLITARANDAEGGSPAREHIGGWSPAAAQPVAGDPIATIEAGHTAARINAAMSDIALRDAKHELMRRAAAGDLLAQEHLNRLYGTDPESLARRAQQREDERSVEEAQPAPKPTITITPWSDGSEMPGYQQLHLTDTLRHVGMKTDKAASEWINGWVALQTSYQANPGTRPSAEATEATLREEWGFHYEDNLRRADERFRELFPHDGTRQQIEYWLGTTPDFLKALYSLAEYEHKHGAAPKYGERDPNLTREEQYERDHQKARENLARRGIKNVPVVTIPDR
jgi:hypothetical protein